MTLVSLTPPCKLPLGIDYNSNNKFLLKTGNTTTVITLLSHPQIAYKLIKAGGAENILQVQALSIGGLNNRKDTTIQ